jgi:hypothetical protein
VSRRRLDARAAMSAECALLLCAAATAALLAVPPRAPASGVLQLPLDALLDAEGGGGGGSGSVGAAAWTAAVKRAEATHAAAIEAVGVAVAAGDCDAIDAAVAAHLQECAKAGAAPVSASYLLSSVGACLDVGAAAAAGALPRGLWRSLRQLMRTRRLAATACPALLPFLCARREVRARACWRDCLQLGAHDGGASRRSRLWRRTSDMPRTSPRRSW